MRLGDRQGQAGEQKTQFLPSKSWRCGPGDASVITAERHPGQDTVAPGKGAVNTVLGGQPSEDSDGECASQALRAS